VILFINLPNQSTYRLLLVWLPWLKGYNSLLTKQRNYCQHLHSHSPSPLVLEH